MVIDGWYLLCHTRSLRILDRRQRPAGHLSLSHCSLACSLARFFRFLPSFLPPAVRRRGFIAEMDPTFPPFPPLPWLRQLGGLLALLGLVSVNGCPFRIQYTPPAPDLLLPACVCPMPPLHRVVETSFPFFLAIEPGRPSDGLPPSCSFTDLDPAFDFAPHTTPFHLTLVLRFPCPAAFQPSLGWLVDLSSRALSTPFHPHVFSDPSTSTLSRLKTPTLASFLRFPRSLLLS
jgi:hypothetical protein